MEMIVRQFETLRCVPVGPLFGTCPRRGVATQQLFIAYWLPT